MLQLVAEERTMSDLTSKRTDNRPRIDVNAQVCIRCCGRGIQISDSQLSYINVGTPYMYQEAGFKPLPPPSRGSPQGSRRFEWVLRVSFSTIETLLLFGH